MIAFWGDLSFNNLRVRASRSKWTSSDTKRKGAFGTATINPDENNKGRSWQSDLFGWDTGFTRQGDEQSIKASECLNFQAASQANKLR
jgi:hypothetical protein